VHQLLAGQTPEYLAANIRLVADTGRPQLRSMSERTCVISLTHNGFDERSFSAAGPRVRNALPTSVTGN